MPRYRFRWQHLPSSLLARLAAAAGLAGNDPAGELAARYGARPRDDLVRDLWPVLRDEWLAVDAAARRDVVTALRAAGVGPRGGDLTTDDGQLQFLHSLRSSPTMRSTVLARLLALGEAAPSAADTGAASAPARRSRDWPELQRRLAEALAVLTDGQYLIIAAKHGHYFVQFAAQGPHGLRAEATGTTFLDRSERYSAQQLAALAAAGWQAPTVSDLEHDHLEPDGSINFFADFDPPVPYGDVARMAVTTLADIQQIRHPTDLKYRAFDDDGREILLPTLQLVWDPGEQPQPEEPSPVDETFESIRARVRDLVRELADSDEIDYDADGDLVLRFGSAVVFVRVLEQPLLVRVLSPMLEEVEAGPALIDRLNELNGSVHFARLVAVGNTVWAAIDLFCMPLEPAHVAYALRLVGEVADQLDDTLLGEFGGRTFFAEHAVPPKAGYAGYL